MILTEPSTVVDDLGTLCTSCRAYVISSYAQARASADIWTSGRRVLPGVVAERCPRGYGWHIVREKPGVRTS